MVAITEFLQRRTALPSELFRVSFPLPAGTDGERRLCRMCTGFWRKDSKTEAFFITDSIPDASGLFAAVLCDAISESVKLYSHYREISLSECRARGFGSRKQYLSTNFNIPHTAYRHGQSYIEQAYWRQASSISLSCETNPTPGKRPTS